MLSRLLCLILNLLSVILSHCLFSWHSSDENVKFRSKFEVILIEIRENKIIFQYSSLKED